MKRLIGFEDLQRRGSSGIMQFLAQVWLRNIVVVIVS